MGSAVLVVRLCCASFHTGYLDKIVLLMFSLESVEGEALPLGLTGVQRSC
jgi:hypothetical protein